MTFVTVTVGSGLIAKKLPMLTDLLALAGAALGVALGVMALARIRREGRQGIVAPALAGAILNGLLVVIWVTNFLAYRARHG